MRVKSGLDLTELDPVPAALDLVVAPAEEVVVAVGAQPHQIPGPIDEVRE